MEQLFYNGTIYTMNGKVGSSLWIKDGMIQDVGDDGDLHKKVGNHVKCYDLNKKCVIPGLIDSHCHLLNTGMVQASLDLSGVESLNELILRGKRFIEDNHIPEGQWIIGRGFNQNLFDNPELPDIITANAISMKHPILLDRVCGHVGALNSEAMKRVGIRKDTHIAGGKIGLDEEGELSGIFYEAALDYVKSMMPKPDKNGYKSLIQSASSYANSLGLTSVHSNDIEPSELDKFMEAIQELEEEQKMTLRIFEEVSTPKKEDLQAFLRKGFRTGDGSEYCKMGNVKLFTDGSLGAHSAYMLEDYSDKLGNKGIAVYENCDLKDLITEANKNNMQVACHAIGDGAITQCISAIEKAQEQNGKKGLRNRIVHCQIADDSLLSRMSTAEIGSDIQPPFVITDWKVAEQAFGARAEHSYRWKTMLNKNIHIAGGSDSPVESISPIWGIHCAVNRADEHDNPEGGWHPDEMLSVEEAVALYTKWAAYLAFEEDTKGTLEPGKLADFIVLSEDIFNIDKSRIKDIKVLGTVVGGHIRYQQNESFQIS